MAGVQAWTPPLLSHVPLGKSLTPKTWFLRLSNGDNDSTQCIRLRRGESVNIYKALKTMPGT